jgi:raffinose/stachyose/melibiose transport system substrate-binding protein
MKRKVISVLMVLVFAAMSFAACGKDKTEDVNQDDTQNQQETTEDTQTDGQNNENTPSPTESAENTEEVELTTVTIPSYRTGEDVGAKFFLPQVERFNAKYEGKYKVIIEESPSNTHTDRIKQLALQDELPAMFQVSDSKWVEDYLVANNKLQDLSEFIAARPEMSKYFIKDSLDFCTKDGKVIALPVTFLKPTGLYYNSALFNPSKPLTEMTWEEFSNELGENKIAYQTAEGGWTVSLILTGILGSLEGGPELLKAGVQNKITDFNNPIFVEAFTILQNSFLKKAGTEQSELPIRMLQTRSM